LRSSARYGAARPEQELPQFRREAQRNVEGHRLVEDSPAPAVDREAALRAAVLRAAALRVAAPLAGRSAEDVAAVREAGKPALRLT